ncbi:hypothetical protein CPB83DRAFT_853134 [Crepidotus variabilis]|uniref:Uncharacterized protein n=1 Tax=Crepidotus variabilis TaxID=179855 RepID=A0A9P6JQP9_9AGAR|nr:hypothetical protein CPB83DRAFT_853134 [Crepidotus variabilis]
MKNLCGLLFAVQSLLHSTVIKTVKVRGVCVSVHFIARIIYVSFQVGFLLWCCSASFSACVCKYGCIIIYFIAS